MHLYIENTILNKQNLIHIKNVTYVQHMHVILLINNRETRLMKTDLLKIVNKIIDEKKISWDFGICNARLVIKYAMGV